VKIKIYRTIILPVGLPAVLYGYEIGSLTLRDEHILSAFENEILRRIFGRARDEVTGRWRKLNYDEPHNLQPSPDIIGVIKSRRMK
jgi:hypothetical protein